LLQREQPLVKMWAGGEQMAVTREDVMGVLGRITLPGGGDAVTRDLIRALTVEGGMVRFVIEAASPMRHGRCQRRNR
jgi:Iron-sulfur cluster assembly protein